ncbi:MAG: DUF418 domain-containing protein [Chloroflexi bacterium]|nr:DUF418 domain-containing protein [Chloroflexota bacterium]
MSLVTNNYTKGASNTAGSVSHTVRQFGGAKLVFVLTALALQLWWSQTWLSHFLFGPAEWLGRVATYRSGQSLRRRGEPGWVG